MQILPSKLVPFFVFLLHLSFSTELRASVFTKPAITRDLFDVQTPVGAYWKDNELQNMYASSEFQ